MRPSAWSMSLSTLPSSGEESARRTTGVVTTRAVTCARGAAGRRCAARSHPLVPRARSAPRRRAGPGPGGSRPWAGRSAPVGGLGGVGGRLGRPCRYGRRLRGDRRHGGRPVGRWWAPLWWAAWWARWCPSRPGGSSARPGWAWPSVVVLRGLAWHADRSASQLVLRPVRADLSNRSCVRACASPTGSRRSSRPPACGSPPRCPRLVQRRLRRLDAVAAAQLVQRRESAGRAWPGAARASAGPRCRRSGRASGRAAPGRRR